MIEKKPPTKWVTLKVDESVDAWLERMAEKHKSSKTRVLYAIVRSAFDADTRPAESDWNR